MSGHRDKQSNARHQQFTTPIVSVEMRTQIQSCTSIHIGITSIAWAQLKLSPNQPTTLTDWSFKTIPEKKMHIAEFIDAVMDIVAYIPESDAYVFETPRVAHQGPQGTPATVNISVQMSQMAAMTAMAMNLRRKCDPHLHPGTDLTNSLTDRPSHVLFMRQFLASRLFQTIIGQERISTATVINSLMQETVGLCQKQYERPIGGEITFGQRFQQLYAAGDGPCKEYMGQSLLMGLSFLRLCILQCPHSLALLKSRGRQI